MAWKQSHSQENRGSRRLSDVPSEYVRFLAVIGILVSFVAVLLIVTFSLVAVIVGRNDSGGDGIGPTSTSSPPPVQCIRASQALGLLRFACKLSGGQVITTREIA